MAVCYLILFVGGFSMVRMPENAVQENAYTLHKSFGTLTMALLTWRIFMLQQVWWRKYRGAYPNLQASGCERFCFMLRFMDLC